MKIALDMAVATNQPLPEINISKTRPRRDVENRIKNFVHSEKIVDPVKANLSLEPYYKLYKHDPNKLVTQT